MAPVVLLIVATVLAGFTAACNPREFAREHGGITRLSIATGNTGGVYYPYGGGLAKVISESIPRVEATAEVTAASVDNLKLLQLGKVDIAFTLADTLDEAVKGRGLFEKTGAVGARTLAVIYPNYTHLVTVEGNGIERVADLRGKVVSTGSPGSGTEVIAFRVLRAAGLDPGRDIRRQALSVNASADALKDDKIDAFFWSGGLPTASVLDVASTVGITAKLIPNDDVLPALQAAYGPGLYQRLSIPKGSYPGQDADVGVIAVENALIVDERMDEALAYDLTRTLFDKRSELAAIHPEARHLAPTRAVAGSPAPFHPGAIRYYQEHGVWNP
ncbi:MAG: TAXI family TRAP transporter solute-binding subunit [Vicinamibacterales bacterium]